MSQNRHIRRRFGAERSRARLLRRLPLSHWPIACLALLALLIQSFVVQTHIHIPQGAGRSASLSLVTLAGTFVAGPAAQTAENPAAVPRDKYPINEDPSNCPLCQEVLHGGRFIAPSAAIVAPPLSVGLIFIAVSESATFLSAGTHFWHSRAPPTRSAGS